MTGPDSYATTTACVRSPAGGLVVVTAHGAVAFLVALWTIGGRDA